METTRFQINIFEKDEKIYTFWIINLKIASSLSGIMKANYRTVDNETLGL